MGEKCVVHGETINEYKFFFFFGMPEGDRSHGKLRRSWVNVLTSCMEIGWIRIVCIYLAEGRNKLLTFVNTVRKVLVP
jgi:hypothetical protein